MKKLGLKLSEPRLESEFAEAHRKMATPYLLVSTTLYLVIAIILLTTKSTNRGRIPLAIITTAVWILSLLVVKKCRRLFDIMVLAANGVLIPWLLNIRADGFINDTPSTIFLRGYSYGMTYCVNQQGFTKVLDIFVLEVIFVIARITALRGIEASALVVLIMFECAAVFMRIHSEIVARRNFFQLHASKEALVKFKDLVTKLPTSLLIFSRDMKDCLFANMKFTEEFPDGNKDTASIILAKMKNEEIEANSSEEDNSLTKEGDDLFSTINNYLQTLPHDTFSIRHNFKYIDGEVKQQFEVNAFSFVWDGKKAIAILLNNITHQQDILTLKIANQNKEMAISTVSHELRNPVNGLLGMTQMMEKQTKDPSLLKTISLFKTNINLLLSIINSILDFQQIQANKLHLNIHPVKLKSVFKTAKSLFEFQCAQKKIAFNIDCTIPKKIRTDKERLSQVIINLCANALKFTFKGGITIFARQDIHDQKRISIGVSDTGIGIKEEDKKKLFTMFGKIDSTGYLNQHGVGLGLLISNCIVKVLNKNEKGCRIQVDTKQENGSTFWFTLPMDYDTGLHATETSIENSSSERNCQVAEEAIQEHMNGEAKELEEYHRRKKLRACFKLPSLERRNSLLKFQIPTKKKNIKRKVIVIVDDNSFNLLVAQQILEGKGFSTFLAYNGKEGVEIVEKLYSEEIIPSLILMDLEMPIMDGIEATRFLTTMMREGNLAKIPIVGLSANDDETTTKACLDAGMSKYCRKPLIEKDLISLLVEYHILPESHSS